MEYNLSNGNPSTLDSNWKLEQRFKIIEFFKQKHSLPQQRQIHEI
jgi:hypothetical protein